MFVVDFICAFLVTVFLSLLFYFGRRGETGPWAVVAAYVLGLVFAVWLSGAWLVPGGLVIWSNHWISYGFLIPILALLAVILSRRPRPLPATTGGVAAKPTRESDRLAVSIFFTLAGLIFVALIGARYL
jgi:hypothetical protein